MLPTRLERSLTIGPLRHLLKGLSVWKHPEGVAKSLLPTMPGGAVCHTVGRWLEGVGLGTGYKALPHGSIFEALPVSQNFENSLPLSAQQTLLLRDVIFSLC